MDGWSLMVFGSPLLLCQYAIHPFPNPNAFPSAVVPSPSVLFYKCIAIFHVSFLGPLVFSQLDFGLVDGGCQVSLPLFHFPTYFVCRATAACAKILNFQLFSMLWTVLKGLLLPFQTQLFLKRLVEQMPMLTLITFYTNGQIGQFPQSVIKSGMPGCWQILYKQGWIYILPCCPSGMRQDPDTVFCVSSELTFSALMYY